VVVKCLAGSVWPGCVSGSFSRVFQEVVCF
jgi:hypothetical protein